METRIFFAYALLRLGQQVAEHLLARANRRYCLNPESQRAAAVALGIAPEDMQKALDYAGDRYHFGLFGTWTHLVAGVALLAAGGLCWIEAWSREVASHLGLGSLACGLVFFGILGASETLFELPFELHRTFRIEQKHGFNRQTLRGFFADKAKGLALGVVLGGGLLSALLLIMERAGDFWWALGWTAVSGFSLLTAWIYPTLLAPIFNTFTPLPEGELRERIATLTEKAGFRAHGLYVMDASRRTAHGNAYFSGLFRQKRIVLFDTLLEAVGPREVVAVLAHELGHFRLNHVRWGLLRGIAATGALFFLLDLCLPLEAFYRAFRLSAPSPYGALAVFGLWLGLLDFLLGPLANWVSRRNEFAADAFAVEHLGTPDDLARALVALREKSHGLPMIHPLFSRVYHSHPPLLERLKALEAL